MTDVNIPVMLGAVAKKPVAPGGDKRLPGKSSNSSFYKQLKQINQKQINLSEKRNTEAMDRGNQIGQKPGEQEIKAQNKPADQNQTQVINQVAGKPDSPGTPNPEVTVKSQVEGDTLVETATDEADMVAATEILGPVSPSDNQDLISFVTSATLSEPVNVQKSDKPEPVATTVITAANPVNNELLLSEVTVSDQKDSSSLQMGIPLQGYDEPVQGLGKPESQIDDAQSMPKVTLQQSGSDISDLSTMNKSKQISASVDILSELAVSLDEINSEPKLLRGNIPEVSPIVSEDQQRKADTTDIAPEQAARPDKSNSDLKVWQDNMPIITPIIGMENNADQPLRDETATSSSLAEETKQEVRSVQTAYTGEKAVKEAPEVRSWIKELLPDQSGKQKTQFQSGAETKQNSEQDSSANNKTSPSTDVKKLIDFETHRLNASRLSREPNSLPESQAKAVSDDGRPVITALSRSDTDLLKTTSNTNVTDSSKNLPTTREIIAQVVQKAELLFTHKLSELRIDLKPEFLGRLTIKVMVEEGIVTARFIAENQQVKHMLESNLHTLRQNLESQGIRVERTEVSVQLNNGGMFDGSEGSRQYLWEEGQFSERHQREGPYPGNQYTGGYEELDFAIAQASSDYDYNENGNLNFLI